MSYVGHWTVVDVEDHRDNPITIPCLPTPRIALIRLEFDEYNTQWSNIIRLCHDKRCEEIKTMFDDEKSETRPAFDVAKLDEPLSPGIVGPSAVDDTVEEVSNEEDQDQLKRNAKCQDRMLTTSLTIIRHLIWSRAVKKVSTSLQ